MVSLNWWGIYIRVSHEQTQTLLKLLGSGAAIDALLAAINVPAFAVGIVAAAIAFAAAWIVASDDGNGVVFYITWSGWLWIENPPAGA
jgi:hypothetical protein